MKAVIILHFGSPQNKNEIAPLIKGIFKDKEISPFKNNIFLSLIRKPIEYLAVRNSIKKYNSINFNPSYLDGLNQLIDILNKKEDLNFKFYLAAQYGRPSIEEAFEKIEDDNMDKAALVPLYPHASVSMYNSIANSCQTLQKGFFTNIHLRWSAPFYDHPLFIKAWSDQIKKVLSASDHLLFCAHAHPLKNVGDYARQVEKTSQLIWESLGKENPMSIAYQSGERMGPITGPSLQEGLNKLILAGISKCLIIPISFVFDNVETLVDIDVVAIPQALKAGMKDVRRVSPPGNCPAIIEMLADIVKNI